MMAKSVFSMRFAKPLRKWVVRETYHVGGVRVVMALAFWDDKNDARRHVDQLNSGKGEQK